MDVEVDLDGVEFKVKGLKINSDMNHEDDLPAAPLLPNNNDHPTVKVTATQSCSVDNDFFPPPPPPSRATNYLWSPSGLTTGQVQHENVVSFLEQVLLRPARANEMFLFSFLRWFFH